MTGKTQPAALAVIDFLRRGPSTAAEIAEKLKMTPSAVAMVLWNHMQLGHVIHAPGLRILPSLYALPKHQNRLVERNAQLAAEREAKLLERERTKLAMAEALLRARQEREAARAAAKKPRPPRPAKAPPDDDADDWVVPDPAAVVAAGIANRTALERAWAAL